MVWRRAALIAVFAASAMTAASPVRAQKAGDPAGPLAYLRPLHDRVILAALTYVIHNPRGDEVSLAVLNAVERSEVEALAGRPGTLSNEARSAVSLLLSLA